jgi:RNA polymerase sigma factor FliA
MLAHENIIDRSVDRSARPFPDSAQPDDAFARLRPALVTENVAMAVRIASKMSRRLPASLAQDVKSAALLGLVEAANRFHPGRGVGFPAFAAKRVRGAILDALRAGDVLPRRARKTARRTREAVRCLEQTLGRAPSSEEIASKLGVDVDEYHCRIAGLCSVQVISLDDVAAVGAGELGDDPTVQAERTLALERLERARERLSEREARILTLYYEERRTLSEIGRLLGVTESRVCQLHGRDIEKLISILAPERASKGRPRRGA